MEDVRLLLIVGETEAESDDELAVNMMELVLITLEVELTLPTGVPETVDELLEDTEELGKLELMEPVPDEVEVELTLAEGVSETPEAVELLEETEELPDETEELPEELAEPADEVLISEEADELAVLEMTEELLELDGAAEIMRAPLTLLVLVTELPTLFFM